MKKIICLLLAVAMLSLCACGKEPQAVEQKQPEQPRHSVPRPVTWADIDAIPIATANMTEEELTERFVRGDVSRNTEGSGLGLNIAKTLMEVQGGSLQLTLDGDLFKVTLTFPAAK